LFTCDVLEHLHPDDLEKAMKEMLRVCTRYFFIKVSGEIEHNREFMDKAKAKYGQTFPDIENLHLTVMSIRKWIIFFEKHGLILIYAKNGLLTFERQ